MIYVNLGATEYISHSTTDFKLDIIHVNLPACAFSGSSGTQASIANFRRGGWPMLLDVSPLRRHRDFRLVFLGQTVSAFGSFLTYVALPVQIYALTKSSTVVGLLGAVELVPLAITALWGGALADAWDRRRLVLCCEALLLVGSLMLAANSMLAESSVRLLFVVAASMSAVNGFHTPSLQSLTPNLVTPGDLPAVSALSWVRSMPPAQTARPAGLSSILEGFRYASRRPELIGTSVVDIVALTFAMPMAVFPALAAQWGGAHAIAYLYSAMSMGGLIVTLFSGWTANLQRRGAAVVLAAALWGAAITALGYANALTTAIACLMVAGAADTVSGLFRMTIWNETIPAELRGRMAAIEQLSYMTGPLLGNARAGFMAERYGVARSIAAGGIVCVVGVIACVPMLPGLWRYRKPAERDVGAALQLSRR